MWTGEFQHHFPKNHTCYIWNVMIKFCFNEKFSVKKSWGINVLKENRWLIEERVYIFSFFFFSFFFLFRATSPHHMEFASLGVESELQLPAYATATATPDLSPSATYTTAHSNARFLTYWVGPGIKPTSSWILVGFVSTEPQQEFQASMSQTPSVSWKEN